MSLPSRHRKRLDREETQNEHRRRLRDCKETSWSSKAQDAGRLTTEGILKNDNEVIVISDDDEKDEPGPSRKQSRAPERIARSQTVSVHSFLGVPPDAKDGSYKSISNNTRFDAEKKMFQKRRKVSSPNLADDISFKQTALPAPDSADGYLKLDKASSMSTTTTGSSSSPRYLNPRIFLTRTLGRMEGKMKRNTITLGQIIDKKALQSAMIYSFYIEDDELFAYLPFKPFPGHKPDVPIYIGRDFNMVGAQNGASIPAAEKEHHLMAYAAHMKRHYGPNFIQFFPERGTRSGCAHSKFGVLVYEGFIRIFITSANLMSLDTVHGDNHWFVVDLPALKTKRKKGTPVPEFEQDLLEHMQTLGCPDEFIKSVYARYDYSAVDQVRLITSKPGAFSAEKAHMYGALRLKDVVKPWMIGEAIPQIEVCTASLGGLDEEWLQGMYHAFSGGQHEPASASGVPPIKIYFPTPSDVRAARRQSRAGAAQIGAAAVKWRQRSACVRGLFYRYKSKDQAPDEIDPTIISNSALVFDPVDPGGKGPLFHMKFIMAFPKDTADRSRRPLYLYLGSANFSKGAWGKIYQDKRERHDPSAKRLAEVNNWEIGVAIKGSEIESMLEPGSTWEDVVPYDRGAARFGQEDRPYSSDAWARGDGPNVFV